MTTTPLPPTEPAVAERLRSLVNGYQVSQAIHVATTLGVPDLLAAGPRSVEDLAAATGTHAPSLGRLLRALAAIGVLAPVDAEGGRAYELTELGSGLRSDVLGSLGPWAAFIGRPHHWESWDELLHAVRTGDTGFAARHPGETVWEWRARHLEESRIFDQAMSGLSAAVALRLADAYDFSRFSVLADLGGGDGTLLATVLPHHPGLHGIVFDQAHVVAGAPARLAAAGVADRATVAAGRFFVDAPPVADAYVLKSVLHDAGDDDAIRILQWVGAGVPPHSMVLIVERVMTDTEPITAIALSDLNMMVNTGGRERTEAEWHAVIGGAGFELTGRIDVGGGWSVIEASRGGH